MQLKKLNQSSLNTRTTNKMKIFALAAFLMIFSCKLDSSKNGIRFITIGTGGLTGVYYPTGGAIAKLVNKKVSVYNLKATVESTSGSVFNINSVLSGNLDFGIVQSDRQYQAFKGLAEWEDRGPQSELRSVFSIHPEAVTLMAAADAGIVDILSLKGKRVNVGDPGSGQRQNAIDALQAFSLDQDSDISTENVKASEAPGLLQDGRIDAFFYTVGHPSSAIKEASAGKRKVRFIPITGISGFLKKFPYYTATTIPISMYPSVLNKTDVKTFGVKATLVTSSRVSEDIVYALTKEVFNNFETFKKLHPSYVNLTKNEMLEGLSAPFHKGALKYFHEVGLLTVP